MSSWRGGGIKRITKRRNEKYKDIKDKTEGQQKAMVNFTYYTPTKVLFGKDTHKEVGEQLKLAGAKKVLIHYGSGSIKKSGLYDEVAASLRGSGIDFVELGGVQPNPRLTLVREGLALCRKENVDFLLAVGGGSVIDSCKAISLGLRYDGDVWDFYIGKAKPTEAVPVGVVLTLAASGSEMSDSSVISNEELQRKYGCNTDIYRPRFAILNPVLTYTLPPYQTACGIVDIMAHIMERYFTTADHVDLTDRLCEAGLKTMVQCGPVAMAEPDNYDARAEIMWAGSLAHNGLMGTGRIPDFGSHRIEHELTAKYGIAHGAGLAIVFPAWMKYVYRRNIKIFAQFANRVWGVEYDFEHPECMIMEGIKRLEAFYRSLDMPTRLKDIGASVEDIAELAQKACERDGSVGKSMVLKSSDIEEILRLAAE